MSGDDATIPAARSAGFFFARKWSHAVWLPGLVAISYAFAAPALGDGTWLGLTDLTWFWAAVCLAIGQQLAVWLVWRPQLGWDLLSRLFGENDLVTWGALFAPLLVAGPLLLFGLAMSDRGSLDLPPTVQLILGLVLLLPALYTLWSVGHYFGLARALGGDHFRLEYRALPIVREGAFRWTGNAMYALAFLGLWSIALLAGSLAALSLALFQHVYVWVYFYCTEEPDMRLIYGSASRQETPER